MINSLLERECRIYYVPHSGDALHTIELHLLAYSTCEVHARPALITVITFGPCGVCE